MQVDKNILQQAKQECLHAGFELNIEEGAISISDQSISSKPFIIDFSKAYYKNLVKTKPAKKQPFAKALGQGSKALDLTAGTLKDSFYMASLGFQVTALERSPTVYLLLMSALEQLSKKTQCSEIYNFIQQNIEIIYNDANSYFNRLKVKPDVIYFDPMFPEKKKQALSQKSMQFFKLLLPADESENAKIAQKALKFAQKRVVIKRPLHAEALTLHVTQRYIGKSIRYDMVSTV